MCMCVTLRVYYGLNVYRYCSLVSLPGNYLLRSTTQVGNSNSTYSNKGFRVPGIVCRRLSRACHGILECVRRRNRAQAFYTLPLVSAWYNRTSRDQEHDFWVSFATRTTASQETSERAQLLLSGRSAQLMTCMGEQSTIHKIGPRHS